MNDDFLVRLNEDISTKFFKNVVLIDEKSGQKVIRLKDKKPIKLPKYSSNIDDAYYIIKKLKSKNYEISLGFNITSNLEKEWHILVSKSNKVIIDKKTAPSLPMLLCLVALEIIEIEKEFDNLVPDIKENIVNIDFSKKS